MVIPAKDNIFITNSVSSEACNSKSVAEFESYNDSFFTTT